MKLAISGQVLAKIMSLEEVFQFLQAVQVSAFELWPENPRRLANMADSNGNGYEDRDIVEVRNLAQRYNIEIACVTMPGAFDQRFAADVNRYARILAHTVETAHQLGSPRVNHYVYHLSLGETADQDLLRRYFEPALKAAERLGVVLVLENEAHDAVRTPTGMLSVLKDFESPFFCTNYDATNYHHASQEGFPYAYELLKDHIAYVHLKNGCVFHDRYPESEKRSGMTGGYAGHAIRYPMLADGAVNIDGLLRRLTRDGYDGYCTLEPHAAPGEVVQYLTEEVGYLRSRGYFL